MRGEYDEVGFPAPPPLVVRGAFRYWAGTSLEWERRCSRCKQWKPEKEFSWQTNGGGQRPRKSCCKLCYKLILIAEYEE